MTQIELAKRLLQQKSLTVPATDEEILAAAYEAYKEEDFILAHEFRLAKTRPEFTREDWESTLSLSGIEKVRNNISALMACMSHGLI